MRRILLKQVVLLALFAGTLQTVCAQPVATVRIMNWNLLGWPSTTDPTGDSTLRCPFYREVVNYAQPDILVTEENTTTYSTTWYLNQVMNANGNKYRTGTFISGTDTNNGIFYNDSLFDFVSNTRIRTPLRDINEFKLVFTATSDTIRIYACHLKASTGTTNEAERASEVDSLRKFTNSLPTGTDFLICGDFNIYSDQESAYQKLIQDNLTDDGNVIDTEPLSGTWNNAAYSHRHTQSTRLTQFGGGASGGLNDRFDMLLMSNGLLSNPGFYYLPNTLTPVGNDGNHYNQSINSGTNTAVPQAVADALYGAADHLPVFADFQVGPSSGIEEAASGIRGLQIYPVPASQNTLISFKTTEPGAVRMQLFSPSGTLLSSYDASASGGGSFQVPLSVFGNLSEGVYFIEIKSNNSMIYRRIVYFR